MPNTTVYFINRGVVRVWKNFAAKNEADRRKIATLTNNDFFGEQSAMMEQEVCLHPPQTSVPAPTADIARSLEPSLPFASLRSHGSSHDASRTPRVACRGRQGGEGGKGNLASATVQCLSYCDMLTLQRDHFQAALMASKPKSKLATSKPRSRLGGALAKAFAKTQVDKSIESVLETSVQVLSPPSHSQPTHVRTDRETPITWLTPPSPAQTLDSSHARVPRRARRHHRSVTRSRSTRGAPRRPPTRHGGLRELSAKSIFDSAAAQNRAPPDASRALDPQRHRPAAVAFKPAPHHPISQPSRCPPASTRTATRLTEGMHACVTRAARCRTAGATLTRRWARRCKRSGSSTAPRAGRTARSSAPRGCSARAARAAAAAAAVAEKASATAAAVTPDARSAPTAAARPRRAFARRSRAAA